LVWHARIEAEHDNLRAAIEWSAGDGTACELQLCAALAHFWLLRGYLGEAHERLTGALARGSAGPTRERAVALDWASYLELVRFDRARARELSEEAVAVARAVGDGRVLATAMRHLATIQWAEVGSTPAVRDALEAAVAAARDAASPREVGYSLSWLGRVVLDLGDEVTSLAMEAEGRRILREVGDRDALSANLGISGENALARGDHAAARRLLEEALVVSREMGNVAAETLALMGLGDLARAEGDPTLARAQYAEALRVCHANGARSFLRPVARTLQRLAAMSIALGDARRGARIFGAEAAARGNLTMFQGRRDRWEADLALARATLGEVEFAHAWDEGRAMTLEEAISYALDLDGPRTRPRKQAGQAGQPR
jgi:tetratricopeptide (TPR) repeat protein